jgi:hypothetical protein
MNDGKGGEIPPNRLLIIAWGGIRSVGGPPQE